MAEVVFRRDFAARSFALVRLLERTVGHSGRAGYISLFNNKDLTGWGYKTNNFNGKTESSDGRYTAKDGILVVNPKEPRLMQVLWTTREFPRAQS